MKAILSPSLMCVDLMNVERDIRLLEQSGAHYLHVDIMDNHFVPNITLCTDFIKQLKTITKMPVDVHLMIENPEELLHAYSMLGEEDYLTIHYESTKHVQRTLTQMKDMGVKVGVALNPSTPLNVLDYIIDDVDLVLLMTVNPGFAGQKLIPATLDKIADLRDYLKEHNRSDVLIQVDGNVSFENAKKMRSKGADFFIGGSSSVFAPNATIKENCEKMIEIINAPKE